jgi:NADH-quinone oxidoreductase subunit L
VQLELILSVIAVGAALFGWLLAHVFYRQDSTLPEDTRAALSGGYKILTNKYYVDEIYGATVVKPLMGISGLVLEVIVDYGILGGLAWLLTGIATLTGAVLQRWQSGNIRAYAAWVAAGAAALLLFVLVPWQTVWPQSLEFVWKMAGH